MGGWLRKRRGGQERPQQAPVRERTSRACMKCCAAAVLLGAAGRAGGDSGVSLGGTACKVRRCTAAGLQAVELLGGCHVTSAARLWHPPPSLCARHPPPVQQGWVTHRLVGNHTALAQRMQNRTCAAFAPDKPQISAYNLCLQDYGHLHQWMCECPGLHASQADAGSSCHANTTLGAGGMWACCARLTACYCRCRCRCRCCCCRCR